MWIAQDEWEKGILDMLVESFGEYCSIKKICDYLEVDRRTIYKAIEEGKIGSLSFCNKNFILTRSLLPLFRK